MVWWCGCAAGGCVAQAGAERSADAVIEAEQVAGPDEVGRPEHPADPQPRGDRFRERAWPRQCPQAMRIQ